MAPRRCYPKQRYEVGIYGLLNLITKKWYIGSSIEMTVRRTWHMRELRRGKHHSQKLQRSYNKHGASAFEFRVLLFCEAKDLEFFEDRAIRAYSAVSNGYNVATEAKGGFMRGRKWPEETKASRVEAMKGFRHTDESKALIRATLAARSDEDKVLHRARVTAARRGKPISAEGRANIVAAMHKRQDDPALAGERRAAALRGWATRRSVKNVVSVEETGLE